LEPGPFLSEQHPRSGRYAVFEDDGTTGYLYLSAPHVPRPVQDCWIYNRIPAPTSLAGGERDAPPPVPASHCVPSAQQSEAPDPGRLQLQWSMDGESVALLLDGLPLGLLSAAEPAGYARYLTQPCPWGRPWDEACYTRLLAGG
jgi:hypothetical protein